MPTNRVQFQKGMSLGEFMRRYGTEEACEQELEAQRWPQGFACLSCGSREYSNFRRGRLLYYQCCGCESAPARSQARCRSMRRSWAGGPADPAAGAARAR